jgi:hypothetical protein
MAEPNERFKKVRLERATPGPWAQSHWPSTTTPLYGLTRHVRRCLEKRALFKSRRGYRAKNSDTALGGSGSVKW